MGKLHSALLIPIINKNKFIDTMWQQWSIETMSNLIFSILTEVCALYSVHLIPSVYSNIFHSFNDLHCICVCKLIQEGRNMLCSSKYTSNELWNKQMSKEYASTMSTSSIARPANQHS
jgi:hypothetical protein